jgi:hypothetical protein
MRVPPPPGENLDLFGGPSRAPSTDAQVCSVEEVTDGGSDANAPVSSAATAVESQLDLFRDARAEIAANAARRAARELAVDEVRRCLAALRPLPAFAPFVADGDACLELIERRDPRWQDAARAVDWIELELLPAAKRFVPDAAAQLLRPALMALLNGASPAHGAVGRSRAHPAHLWQLLGEPAQAIAALEADPRWRDHPDTLAWHAALCEDAGLNTLALVDVVDLCLSWSTQAEHWLESNPAWAERWTAWCELDDALPMYAFPAWARLRCIQDVPVPDATDERPGAELLRVADQLACNPADLALRKALQRQSPALLSAFLEARRTRDG